jgi:hypothetical protein
MTDKKPPIPFDTIHPHFSYRVNSPIALHVIGLGPGQIKEAVDNGELPAPVKLTSSGRAKAWTGQQLLDIQRERLARAAVAQRSKKASQ